MLFDTLPEAYSLGKVSNWFSDESSALVQHIQAGMKHIEIHGPNVEPPLLRYENALSQRKNQVTYQGTLVIHAETEDEAGVIYYTEDGSDPTISDQRQKLSPGDTLTIKGNRKVKLVVADGHGNYSAVQTVEAIDELEKHKIVRSLNYTALEETITFVFPTNKAAARTTISSLFSELAITGIYSGDELKEEILRALDALRK